MTQTMIDPQVLQAALTVLQGALPVSGQKHDASGTPSTPYYTGPGGLFGVSQHPEREVFSTRIKPRGLAAALPWFPTVSMNPLYPYLTGFTDNSGSNPSTACGTCKTPGTGKSCYQTAALGRYCRDTRELDIRRVGQQIDPGDTFDYRFINDPLAGALASLFPGLPDASALLNGREMLARMIEVGVSYQNLLCQQLYTGNPANNVGEGYKEFPGLDILIGTNKVDAITGTDCPSLDSIVKDAAYGLITDAAFDVVNVFVNIVHQLEHNADGMDLSPLTLVIAMRENLFYELTKLWPCAYLSTGCAIRSNGLVQSIDPRDQIEMRDDMRRNQYLLMDGKKYPVVFDDCIAEEHEADQAAINQGEHASDIYFIPMTVGGGRPVTFWQHYNYSAGAMQAAADAHMGSDFWTDGGRYLWTNYRTRWCVKLASSIEPRVILLTPFLAARLTNVRYAVTEHTRDPLNTDSYFVNGGVSTPRAAPSYYSDWDGLR